MAEELSNNRTASANDDDDSKGQVNEEKLEDSSDDKGNRIIGKWYIKETLGRGGYSWVKRGVDIKSGKVFALKFMERRYDKNNNLKLTQIKTVQTEIDSLRLIGKSEFCIRLFAYNLNQKYPDKNGKKRDVILLVLEYAAGGELFDLLYYTDTLEPILARTYFRQLISGLEALHKMGIIHRDIKPQNLLLDSNYKLKITDFGLSKICDLTNKSDGGGKGKKKKLAEIMCSAAKVGTRGYQAPELVEKKQYNCSIDIFAAGVVLFILMTGYPPFKNAKSDDKWYKFIATADYLSFWRAHRNCGLQKTETDLISRMLAYDYSKRVNIKKIKKHQWWQEQILNDEELIAVLQYRHEIMEKKRAQDPVKTSILQNSLKVRPLIPKGILDDFKKLILASGHKLDDKPPPLPDNVRPNITRDIYTKHDAYYVLQCIKIVVKKAIKGEMTDPGCDQIFENNKNGDDEKEKKNNDDEEHDNKLIDLNNFCLQFTVALMDGAVSALTVHVQLFNDKRYDSNLVVFNIVEGSTESFLKVRTIFVKQAAELFENQIEPKEPENKIKNLYNLCFPHKEKTNEKQIIDENVTK